MDNKHIVRNVFALLPIIITMFLLIFSIVVFYPGLFSIDSINSYTQFKRGIFDDWNPPFFTIWWEIFRIYGATFLVNLILYYGGVIAILIHLYRNKRNIQAYILLLFCVNILFITLVVNVWKDITFTAVLLDIVALFLWSSLFKSPVATFSCFLLFLIGLFLATTMRGNGVFASLPLMVFFIWNFFLKKNTTTVFAKFIFSLLLTVLVTSVFLLLSNVITYRVYKAVKLYPQSYMMINDMSHIECATNHEFEIPLELFRNSNRSNLCSNVRSDTGNYLFWGGSPSFIQGAFFGDSKEFSPDSNKISYEIIKSNWLSSLKLYPRIYLVYRLDAFTTSYFNNMWGNSTYTGKFPELYADVDSMYWKAVNLFSVKLAWINVVCSCFMLILCIIYRRFELSFWILISSFCYLGGWFFLLPQGDARYFFWNYLACVLSIVFFDFKSLRCKK